MESPAQLAQSLMLQHSRAGAKQGTVYVCVDALAGPSPHVPTLLREVHLPRNLVIRMACHACFLFGLQGICPFSKLPQGTPHKPEMCRSNGLDCHACLLSKGCWAAGLLASGIIPVVRHCLENLLTANAHVIPASATVFAQVAACPAPYMPCAAVL